MPTGDINLSSNFNLSSQRPLDDRLIALTLTERNNLPLSKRYDMMIVSVTGATIADHKVYQLRLGTVDTNLANNANWVDLGTLDVVDHIDFTQTPDADPEITARLQWDPVENCLSFGVGDGTISINKEIYDYYVDNSEGGVIVEGDVVSVVAISGNRQAVDLTDATMGSFASSCIGMVTAVNGTLRVTKKGRVHGLNTQGMTEGMPVYVNYLSPGKITQSIPPTGQYFIHVGIVEVAHNGNGIVDVDIRVVPKLQDLSNVDEALLAEGGIPSWNVAGMKFDFRYIITNYLLRQAIIDAKLVTGWVDGDNIQVSYSYTDRQITLTGDLRYYWRGTLYTLTSPYTFTAQHVASANIYFLYSVDGSTFTWSTTAWAFSDLMVAVVRRGATQAESFALRETHKASRNPEAHKELHNQIGTYRLSGGILTAGTWTPNDPTDASVTPGFDAAVLQDEDLATSLTAWTQGTYTVAYVGGSLTMVFDTTKTRPFYDAGAGTYMQINDPVAGTIAAGTNNQYLNVYQILVPVCSDSDSQKYKVILLQPQKAYSDLASAQAENVTGLVLGNFANLFSEFVFHARITFITASGDSNAGKCRIATNGVTYLTGSKANQINVSGYVATSHANLAPTTLVFTASGHTGTANRLLGTNGSGAAAEYLAPPPQIQSITGAGGATFTHNCDSYTHGKVTALSGTLTMAAPSGTPADMKEFVLYVKDDGTSRTLSWNGAFVGTMAALPTSTTAGKQMVFFFVYNSATSTWQLMNVSIGV